MDSFQQVITLALQASVDPRLHDLLRQLTVIQRTDARRPAVLGRGRSAPRYSLSESLAADRHLVCAFIDGMPSMSAEQWAALLAERQRVGRCLCDSEARAVLEAVGGHDVDD